MSYTYDADGTLASKTDANNNTETYTYDTYQRLTAIPDRQQTFTYDTAPRAPSDATAYGFCSAPGPKVAGRLNATLKPKLTTSLRAAGRGPCEMVENWLRCFVVSTSRATNHARRARSARRRPPRAGSPPWEPRPTALTATPQPVGHHGNHSNAAPDRGGHFTTTTLDGLARTAGVQTGTAACSRGGNSLCPRACSNRLSLRDTLRVP